MREARGLNGVLRFDGQTVEVIYDADEFGERKVRAADLEEITGLDFRPATESEPGFVKFEGRDGPFGLRFDPDAEADVRHIGKSIEAELGSNTSARMQVTEPNDKPFYKRWWVWAIGLVAVLSLPAIIDPEGFEQRVAEREAERAAERAEEAAEEAAELAAASEERRSGFHCLSGWDGSNRSFVQQVERLMRNPDSFEHIETRISPVQDGEHGTWMTFRAENGFGGMNVERMYARINHETCEARVLPDGPGS